MSDVYGIFAVQNVEAAALELCAGIRTYSFDDGVNNDDDLDTLLVDGLFRF